MVKEFLSRRGVSYTEKDVSRDRAAATEMMRKSGQQGVPQILIGDQIVVGFNRGRLEALLRPYELGAPPTASAGVALGVRVADAARHAPGGGPGAYVGGVKEGSIAARGGLETGDVILALDGHPIATADDLIARSRQLQPNRTVSAVVMRNGQRRQVTLTT